MRDPHVHPIRNTLTASAVAGVMLAAIAGCSGQALSTWQGDAWVGGVTGPGGGARTGVIFASANAGEGRDGAMEASPGHTAGISWRNSDNHSAATNQSKSLGLSLPQRYLAF
jgi:hypothetical protein